MNASEIRYPPIADYALITNCHCVALVSRSGSIDWCCMPRIDSDSLFGRLLDWDKGGYCAIRPNDDHCTSSRRYIPGTMMLETHYRTEHGEAILYDFFTMGADPLQLVRFNLVRIVEGIRGEIDFQADIYPRFDYGEIIPYVRRHKSGAYTAIGSNKGLVIYSDIPLEGNKHHGLNASFHVAEGQRVRLVLQFEYPELIEPLMHRPLPDAAQIDQDFEQTRVWWTDWSSHIQTPFELDSHTLRSAITLKALCYERTGAIAAAATTSLPEAIGEERNWDYRFSWVRDSVFAVRALYLLGFKREAIRFQQFIERSAAGSAAELQVMFGVDGKRRLTEIDLGWLEGYRQSKPVRVGNCAAKQLQLDIYGELMEMAWRSHARGHPTDPSYWNFLVDVANTVCENWQQPDHGIWEMRSEPVHFVHSKVMCWAALNRAIMLADEYGFDAPLEHWMAEREQIRNAVESQGYDAKRGVFVQAFGSQALDAALLLMPRVGFIPYQDQRMMRTADAICSELEFKGLLRRYNSSDNLSGYEGVFLPCTFWLVACLAYQNKTSLAWQYYERAIACSNDLGLFSEEFDTEKREMLGNFPQVLTHVSQITARLALAEAEAG